jgi:putative chitinase
MLVTVREDNMYKITPEILRKVSGVQGNKKVIDGLVEHLPEALEKYGITTKLRLAHFLAQIAHESDHFRTTEEYASGRAYEGRRDLGNIRKGDGVRFKGRGVIQLTGRANYQRYGDILGIDLVNHPELAATPRISVLTALEYWKQRKINALADRDDVRLVTRAINGGYNGLEDRKAKLARAKQALKTIETFEKPEPAPKKVEPPKAESVVVEKIEQPNTNTIIEVVETVANTSNDIPMFVEIDLTNQ